MTSITRRTVVAALFGLFLSARFLQSARADTAAFSFPPPANAAEAARYAFYSYDRDLPLNVELKPLITESGKPDDNAVRTRYHLVYDSVHDQRVTAILTVPKRFPAPHPAILLVHGAGGNKDVDYIHAASEALVQQGYATLSLDTQYRGERLKPGRNGDLQPDSYTSRDAWIQSVIDMRRGVDYLTSRPDIDPAKIGYLGFSMGGMLGSILGGVEPRISCFCLAVPGGGFVELAKQVDKYPLLKQHWPVTVTPEVLRRVEDIANVIDPVHFVGRILPRPLLIIVAKHDEIIPPEASQALIVAAHAKEPDNVKRMETGHALTPAVIFDIRGFFNTNLGRPTTKSE